MLATLSVVLTAALQVGDSAAYPAGSLSACRAIADGAARLACYDAAMTRLDGNPVEDREATRRATRSQFGMAAAPRQVERVRAAEPPRIDRIDATVRAVSTAGDGRYLVSLDDDALWHFTEEVAVLPKVGDRIHIRRAALGSYMGSINGGREARIQRRR